MSSSLVDQVLKDSLIGETLKKLEAGEVVDFPLLQRRQVLQLARVGELFALETIQAERDADDGFQQYLSTI